VWGETTEEVDLVAAQANPQQTSDRIVLSRETGIGVGVVVLALVAMGVDHLLGDDPGLEDPPTFLIAAALILALAALLFGRVVPNALTASAPGQRAARDGLICSLLAIVPGFATLWLGLPFVLAGAGLALGLAAWGGQPSKRAGAAIAIALLALAVTTGAYVVEAIDKLG
jgi:hypothetical protein